MRRTGAALPDVVAGRGSNTNTPSLAYRVGVAPSTLDRARGGPLAVDSPGCHGGDRLPAPPPTIGPLAIAAVPTPGYELAIVSRRPHTIQSGAVSTTVCLFAATYAGHRWLPGPPIGAAVVGRVAVAGGVVHADAAHGLVWSDARHVVAPFLHVVTTDAGAGGSPKGLASPTSGGHPTSAADRRTLSKLMVRPGYL